MLAITVKHILSYFDWSSMSTPPLLTSYSSLVDIEFFIYLLVLSFMELLHGETYSSGSFNLIRQISLLFIFHSLFHDQSQSSMQGKGMRRRMDSNLWLCLTLPDYTPPSKISIKGRGFRESEQSFQENLVDRKRESASKGQRKSQ